jgi:hypothetical protein
LEAVPLMMNSDPVMERCEPLGACASVAKRLLDLLSAKQRQLDVSWQNSVTASTAYCFLAMMRFAQVVSVNPAVWLVNDPLMEPNARAV